MNMTQRILLAALIFSLVLPGIAASDDTQLSPPLQLLQPQQSPGQALQSQAAPPTLHDIQGPVSLPEPVPYLLYSLIGLAALALLLGAYWWFYRRKQPIPPPIPPGVRARDELMRARELMSPEQALQYMERISFIVRTYMEARFALKTTRQTTREFFVTLSKELSHNHDLATYSDELKVCLERCDLAKFAHQPAALDDLRVLEDNVLYLVNQTEPPGQESSEQNSTGGGN